MVTTQRRFPVALIARVAGLAIGLAVLVLVIAWVSGLFIQKIPPGWSDRSSRAAAGQPVEEVHQIEKAVVEESVGTLRSSSRTIVAARLLAAIAEVHVSAGQEVRRGDVLITLDAQEYVSRLEQAQQAMAAAESARELAEQNFDRVSRLKEQSAISNAEFDAANSRLLITRAERLRAGQAVSEAEVLVSYQTIRAPKDGRIVDRYAEPGDLAQPGIPLLSMYDPSSLRLETPVMEHLASQLQVGQSLTAYIDALNREVTAVVREIVPQADAASRSFLVKSSIDSSPQLYEGMFGRLRIPGGERRHLCLNTDAIVRIGQLEYVDVLLSSGEVERRLIRTGELGIPGRQEVLSGVAAGEKVLLRVAPNDSAETVEAAK